MVRPEARYSHALGGNAMIKLARGILAALVLGCGAASAEEAPPPPIRQFDIETIRKLGRAIYEQDQDAWHATDLLKSRYSDADLVSRGLRGWIVDSFPDRDVVRFVRDGANGPEALYDVTYRTGAPPALSEPQDRALSAEERAKYDARTLALASIHKMCFDRLNPVVLKDPERDGWLVWILAATTDPKEIVIGGHTRFTMSADGKTIVQEDKLSHSCQAFTKTTGPNGEPAYLMMGQLVSQIPVETYVFASLSYAMPLRVGTPDGKAWKVDADRITPIDMDMPDIDGAAARTLAGWDESCMAAIDDGEKKFHTVPVKGVIAETESAEKYVADVPAGAKVKMISCGRPDFFLAPNDYKVLFGMVPLMIVSRKPPSQSGTLHLKDGKFELSMFDGALTDGQQKAVQTRLDQYQNKVWPKP